MGADSAMTLILPIYQDDRCTVAVTPMGRGAMFRVSFFRPDETWRPKFDAGRATLEIGIVDTDLRELEATMARHGWTIVRIPQPMPGGPRLTVRAGTEEFSWSSADGRIRLAGAPPAVTFEIDLPVADIPTLSWSARAHGLDHAFEQLLLGPYDGRGKPPDRTPPM